MTTEAQLIANRQNAQLSTGPVSLSGKDIVSRNGLKHGIFSKRNLIVGESRAELKKLSDQLNNELRPHGVMETLLVDWIVTSIWRLCRASTASSQMLNKMQGIGDEFRLSLRYGNYHSKILSYETVLERRVYTALKKLFWFQMIRSMNRRPSITEPET